MKKVLAILIFALALLVPYAVCADDVINAPDEVSPGGIYIIIIGQDSWNTFISAELNGSPLPTFMIGDMRAAFVGIDVGAAPGKVHITVTRKTPLDQTYIQEATMKVLSKKFPQVTVKRPLLSKRDLAQIIADKEKIAYAMRQSVAVPAWADNFGYPTTNPAVSKGGGFGLRRKSSAGVAYHAGVDFWGQARTTVHASNGGTVVLSEKLFLEGNCVIVDHGLGLYTTYMHLDSLAVNVGDSVSKGDALGIMGATGRVTGRHVHFSVTLNGARVDPMQVIGALGLGYASINSAVEDPANSSSPPNSSAPQQNTPPVSVGPAPTTPVNPDLLTRSAEAKKVLTAVHVSLLTEQRTVISKVKGRRVTRTTRVIVGKEIALATLTPVGDIRVIRIRVPLSRFQPKGGYIINSIAPATCDVKKIGGGGVNTRFEVVCDGAREIVLASLHPPFDDRYLVLTSSVERQVKQAIYTPYSDDLAQPAIVSGGKAYFEGEIHKATEELIRQKVGSRAIAGMLVAHLFEPYVLFRLGLIEHIDHDEFEKRGAKYSSNKVLTIFGTNRENAYQYSVSPVGALCLMQIMPSTYVSVRRDYPEARMPLSALEGSCSSHKSAVKAAYLVLDSKLAAMPDDFKQKFLRDPETYGLYLAVAYNGGERRARDLYHTIELSRLSEILANLFAWFEPHTREFKVMRKETWVYLKKYMDITKEFKGKRMIE